MPDAVDALAMDALLFQRPDHALDHVILLRDEPWCRHGFKAHGECGDITGLASALRSRGWTLMGYAGISLPHSNEVPSTQMQWGMTASFRATATWAFFMPFRLANRRPQALPAPLPCPVKQNARRLEQIGAQQPISAA
nr:hypothetical protein [Sinirhodobacter populi]